MHESFAEALIPLGDQPHLRNKYANFLKAVRIGRLLEDLDTMAGKIMDFINLYSALIPRIFKFKFILRICTTKAKVY